MNEPTKEQIKEFWEWCGFGNITSRKNSFMTSPYSMGYDYTFTLCDPFGHWYAELKRDNNTKPDISKFKSELSPLGLDKYS